MSERKFELLRTSIRQQAARVAVPSAPRAAADAEPATLCPVVQTHGTRENPADLAVVDDPSKVKHVATERRACTLPHKHRGPCIFGPFEPVT